MIYGFLWSDPEPDHLIESGSFQKVRIRADPDPQHWPSVPYVLVFTGMVWTVWILGRSQGEVGGRVGGRLERQPPSPGKDKDLAFQGCGSAFIFADPDPAVFLNMDPDPFAEPDPEPGLQNL